MECRTWPPFYEKDVNGECVSIPPKVEKESIWADVALFAAITAIIALPILIAGNMKSNYYPW